MKVPPLQRRKNRFRLRVNRSLYPASALKKAAEDSPFPVRFLAGGREYKEFELETPKLSQALKWANYLFWAARIKDEAKR